MRVGGEEIVKLMQQCAIRIDYDNLEYSTIFKDIGLDSLDFANLLLAVEEKYGVTIPDEEVDGLSSVQAIVNFLGES